MACTRPLKAYLPEGGGRPRLYPFPGKYREVQLPCGRCVSCREARTSEWAARCVIEKQRQAHAYFLTLTYSDEHLPPDGGEGPTLRPGDLQLFWKRLRQHIVRNFLGPVSYPIKFLACGEYGERTQRPHYHAILFGFEVPDLEHYKQNRGFPLYRSVLLEKLWRFGYVQIGEVTAASSAYVARYIQGKNYAPDAYQLRWPPFLRCSHGLGVLSQSEVPDDDRINIAPGVLVPTPRSTLKALAHSDPLLLSDIKAQRAASAAARARRPGPTDAQRDAVAVSRLKRFSRDVQ